MSKLNEPRQWFWYRLIFTTSKDPNSREEKDARIIGFYIEELKPRLQSAWLISNNKDNDNPLSCYLIKFKFDHVSRFTKFEVNNDYSTNYFIKQPEIRTDILNTNEEPYSEISDLLKLHSLDINTFHDIGRTRKDYSNIQIYYNGDRQREIFKRNNIEKIKVILNEAMENLIKKLNDIVNKQIAHTLGKNFRHFDNNVLSIMGSFVHNADSKQLKELHDYTRDIKREEEIKEDEYNKTKKLKTNKSKSNSNKSNKSKSSGGKYNRIKIARKKRYTKKSFK
jgi:hypothetical protein